MIASAYEIVASDEADNGNYNASMKHLDDMLRYAGYDEYYYNQAVFTIVNALIRLCAVRIWMLRGIS